MHRVKRKSVGERRNQQKMRMRETRQNAQTEKINIKPEDIDRSDLNIFKGPDGGSVNPAFPSHDKMVPSGPSDANSYTHSQTHSHTHSHTHSSAHCDTNRPTDSTAHSPTHSDTHSPTYSDTHSPTHSGTHSPTHTPPDGDTHPHNDSHRTLIAGKKSFAAQFF